MQNLANFLLPAHSNTYTRFVSSLMRSFLGFSVSRTCTRKRSEDSRRLIATEPHLISRRIGKMYVHSELLSQEMRPILQNIAISFRYIETARRRKESGNRANLLSVRLSLKKFSPRQTIPIRRRNRNAPRRTFFEQATNRFWNNFLTDGRR